jgi:hypothetical protein
VLVAFLLGAVGRDPAARWPIPPECWILFSAPE